MTTNGTSLMPNMDVGQPGKLPRNTSIPLDLGNVSLLGTNEELVFKHDIASVMLDTREAEALVVQTRLNEAKVAVSLAASHGETAKVALAAAKAREAVATAEVQLAVSREKEACHRVNYFSRLFEIAHQNINDARLQVIQLEVEEEKTGVKLKENGGNGPEERKMMVTLD
ncbi:hypothetical protein B0H16DRAFT_1714399 [Mycena metata]|uniref:Uncharacterized protein n=1 Tax=Mycena metata TaxID=1033252 RepID=A0AAD7JUR0_9AGAR|nr:hypothetical protein B0H16DRAFT_1714399 [Mycena metata]